MESRDLDRTMNVGGEICDGYDHRRLHQDASGRFGTATAWAKEFEFTNPGPVTRFLRTTTAIPYKTTTYRNRPLDLWHELSLQALPTHTVVRQESERSIGGNSNSQTVRSWEYNFQVSSGYIRRRLPLIKATGSAIKERKREVQYSFHTVLAALENWENRFQATKNLMPDPERGTLIGSVSVWAQILAVGESGLEARLQAAHIEPISLGQRDLNNLYTEEQLQECAPDFLNPPQWLAPQTGVTIVPGEAERYISVDDRMRHLLPGSTARTLDVISSRGKPATYVAERDALALQGKPVPSPVGGLEYIQTVAATHPLPFHREQMDILRGQAIVFPPGAVVRLDTRGLTTVSTGQQLAPRSVVIDRLCLLESRSDRAILAAKLLETPPLAMADVTWPGHWDSTARLWLYDATMLETSQVVEDTPESAEPNQHVAKSVWVDYLEHTNSAGAMPLQGARFIPNPSADSQSERGLRLAQPPKPKSPINPVQAAQERRIRQQAQNYQRLKDDAEAKELAALRQNLRELQVTTSESSVRRRDELILRLHQIESSQIGTPKEQFKTPLTWVEQYDRSFPELTVTQVRDCISNEGTQSRIETFGGSTVFRIAERDVLRLLLSILDERERRHTR